MRTVLSLPLKELKGYHLKRVLLKVAIVLEISAVSVATYDVTISTHKNMADIMLSDSLCNSEHKRSGLLLGNSIHNHQLRRKSKSK